MFFIRKRYFGFSHGLGVSAAIQRRPFSTKNFYEILNVQRNSSKNEIKQAYRKLALKYHPDRNPNNRKESEKMFREITEAYETLSDENKKKIYDSQLNHGFSAGNFGNNYSNMSSNGKTNYTYQTRRMSDEEIEKVFKNVFGTMNLNDIFKSNVFGEGNFSPRGMENDFFTKFGSAGSYRSSSDNIKQTNIKTEIIPRGNKIIEKTTKIITYHDGVVKQEITEREISGNSKEYDMSDFDVFYKNNFNKVDPRVSRSEFVDYKKMGKENSLGKQVMRYAFGIISIATRRILVNFVIQVMRRIIQGIIHMLRRR
ncbi:DnaJ domain containing protein [Plasmodium cynomolgi strain B]|uniref:DnaJ domain containing protein n=1 Tax=Plasmodium cynomolgi (strain B) TaxID=1120755 RepID=K6UE54_PLACD|nr:DnaJ domain containing protein [Plasmodium cynomolgi strain B]GAB67756.1 DnaJ domain containing protein [Plasmodium cynomolgi strain B]